MQNQTSSILDTQIAIDEQHQVDLLENSLLKDDSEVEHTSTIQDIHLQSLHEQPTTTTITTTTAIEQQEQEDVNEPLEVHGDDEEQEQEDDMEGEHEEPLHDAQDESAPNSPMKDGQSTPSLGLQHPLLQQPTPISNMPSPRTLQAQMMGQVEGSDPLAEPRQLTEEEMQHQQMMMAQQFYYPMHQQQMFMPRYPYPDYSAMHPGMHPGQYAPYPGMMRPMYPHTPMRATRQQPEGPKRTRTILSEEVVEYLNREFKANKFPPPQQRDAIATALNLSPKIVSNWFQNKRQGFKRDMELMGYTVPRGHGLRGDLDTEWYDEQFQLSNAPVADPNATN